MKRTILAVVALSTLVHLQPVAAADQSPLDPLSAQAADAFKKNQLLEAVDLEERAVKENPQDWLRHSALSFYYWQQGNVITSITEGETAVKLNSQNELLLTNLAKMKEGLDDWAGAIPLYEAAKKVAPEDWVPVLGLARCYLKGGQEDKCLSLLQTMATEDGKDFAWYQELGDTYLRLDKPALAVNATAKATKLALTPEQKAANSSQLMMALLRDNQIEPARALEKQVFATAHPRDYELYVRAGAALLNPAKPSSADMLVQSAEENLTTSDDGDGFFRLGRVFEQKADLVAKDATKYSAWMALAGAAYRKAIALNVQQPAVQAKYHVALVGLLEREGNLAGMTEELSQAKLMDQFGQLAPFLQRYVSAATATTTSAEKKPAISQKNHCDVNLTSVNFHINGLNCACQISRAEEALGKVPGVGFVHVIPNLKPYQGTLLVDESTTSVKELFVKAAETFREVYKAMKTPLEADYEVFATKPVKSIESAVRIAQDCELGDALKFFNSFKPVTPVMPVNQLAATSSANIQ